MKLTDEQIDARKVHLEDQESMTPESWWWLSFADPDAPPGMQFLGVSLVRARGIISASKEAYARKINPGGQVMGVGLPEDTEIPFEYAYRLLCKEDAESLKTLIQK